MPPLPSNSRISSCGIFAATSSIVGGTKPVDAEDGGGCVAAVWGSAAGRLSSPSQHQAFRAKSGGRAGGDFAAALRAELSFAHGWFLG